MTFCLSNKNNICLKACNHSIFVAKMYDYALIDSF